MSSASFVEGMGTAQQYQEVTQQHDRHEERRRGSDRIRHLSVVASQWEFHFHIFTLFLLKLNVSIIRSDTWVGDFHHVITWADVCSLSPSHYVLSPLVDYSKLLSSGFSAEEFDKETGQVLCGMDKLPADLRQYVQEDNDLFDTEIEEWDVLQAPKAEQGKSLALATSGSATCSVFTPSCSPQPLSIKTGPPAVQGQSEDSLICIEGGPTSTGPTHWYTGPPSMIGGHVFFLFIKITLEISGLCFRVNCQSWLNKHTDQQCLPYSKAPMVLTFVTIILLRS